MPRPGRRAARAAGRADRAVVGRGRGARRAAARRPHDRAVRRPLPRPLARTRPSRHYTYHPPMTPAAGAGGPGTGRAQLGPRRHHRPARRCGRGALRHRHRELGVQPVRRTTTAWCSTTTASVTTTSCAPTGRCRPARRSVGVRLRRTRRAAASPRSSSTAQPCGSVDLPFVMQHHLQHRPERRVRPRLAGQLRVHGPIPFAGSAAPGRHPAGPARRSRCRGRGGCRRRRGRRAPDESPSSDRTRHESSPA